MEVYVNIPELNKQTTNHITVPVWLLGIAQTHSKGGWLVKRSQQDVYIIDRDKSVRYKRPFSRFISSLKIFVVSSFYTLKWKNGMAEIWFSEIWRERESGIKNKLIGSMRSPHFLDLAECINKQNSVFLEEQLIWFQINVRLSCLQSLRFDLISSNSFFFLNTLNLIDFWVIILPQSVFRSWCPRRL